MAIRALVTLRLVSDVETLMRRVAHYTKEHFGDDLRLEAFINNDSGRVIWLNSAADEDTLVRWEHAMSETGIRAQVMGPTLEPISVELLESDH